MGLFRQTPDPTGQTEYGLLEGSDDLIGATLQDTYVIDRVVGEGGMGRVYEAHHTRIARKRYAIKVLRAEMAGSPEVRSRFQREADAAASIEHPNVVSVNDFGYAPDGRPYLVCEYLDGIELSQFITMKKRLAIPEAIVIGRQICHALEAAHNKGVIHRDLKPENVFMVGSLEKPEIKVLDFGLSRFMEAQSTHVTRTGMVMGTPAYMAPEQARGERADHRVDIYGVGAILYSALTGHSPFEEDSPQQAVLAVMSKEPPRPRAHEPSIPEQLELVIQRAMAREPAERYQSMAELDAALSVFEMTRIEMPEAGGPRDQLLSALGSMGDEEEAINARTQVVLLLILAFFLLLLGLVSTLYGGQELLWGKKRLSSTEFSLIVAAVIGTLMTPTVLFIRWLKRRFWNNSLKMIELARKIRGPVIGAAAVYGIVVLLGRTLDGCGTQLDAVGAAPDISGWSGWNPIIFVVAAAGALAVAIRRWLLYPSSGFVRRVIAGPVVISATVIVTVVVLQYGFRAKAHTSGGLAVAREPRAASSGSGEPSGSSEPIANPAGSSAAIPPEARAPSDKLSEAIPKGVDALVELKNQYPKDPAVLEPLALALGQQQTGYGQALEVLDTLFTVAPHKAGDKELDALVTKIALGSGDASNHALDLMARRMGKIGPDMLYDLMLTSGALRHATREKLDDAETKKNFSPELAIAFELRTAKTCEERIPLLQRASRNGDARSAAVLLSLSTGTKHGCGPRQNKSCPPPCPSQAASFKRVAVDIQNRVATRK